MTTVDGINEHKHRERESDVSRAGLSSGSTDQPRGEYPMSTLGARGYPEWKQNPAQWHIR